MKHLLETLKSYAGSHLELLPSKANPQVKRWQATPEGARVEILGTLKTLLKTPSSPTRTNSTPEPTPHPRVNREKLFKIDGQSITAREYGEKVREELEKKNLGARALEQYDAVKSGQYSNTVFGHPEEFKRVEKQIEKYNFTPTDIQTGWQKTKDTYSQTLQDILEGEHGDKPYTRDLVQALERLNFHEGKFGSHSGSFEYPNVGQRPQDTATYINLSSDTVASFQNRTAATLRGTDPGICSPENLVIHEMAHALDTFVTNAKLAHEGRDPYHHTAKGFRRRPSYGFATHHAFEFEHLHNALAQHAEFSSQHGHFLIPSLPTEFQRLHYPTAGVIRPGDSILHYPWNQPGDELLQAESRSRGSLGSEWGTTLTELRRSNPAALDALDMVFPHPEGKKLKDSIDQIWGFPRGGDADPKQSAALAKKLMSSLYNQPEKTFLGFDQVTESISENPLYGGQRVRSYAGMELTPHMEVPMGQKSAKPELDALLTEIAGNPDGFWRDYSQHFKIRSGQNMDDPLSGEELKSFLTLAYLGLDSLPVASHDFASLKHI